MPRTRPPYTPEFRQQMVEFVRAGRSPEELAREFEPSAQAIRNWVGLADRDPGRSGGPGRTRGKLVMAAYTLAEKRALLLKHFLFKDLRHAELDRIARFARVESVDGGRVLFRKGDPARSLIGIMAGKIAITAELDGQQAILNVLGTGELFGEIALLDGKDRTATANVLEDSDLLVVERRDFLALVKRDPELTERLMVILCERIRHISDLYEDRFFLFVPARLAKKLLKLAEEFGSPHNQGTKINLKLSQTRLGEMVGASRRIVNGLLGEWTEAGLINKDRGYIIVRDPDGLRDVIDEWSDRRQ